MWSGPWATNAHLTQVATLDIDSSHSLPTPAGYHPAASGGHLAMLSQPIYRGLAADDRVDLTSDQPLYISFVARVKAKEAGKSSSGFSLVLHDKLERVLAVSCTSSGKLAVSGAFEAQGDRPAVAKLHHYVWVIRITSPDLAGQRRVQIRLYHQDNTLDTQPPANWSLETPAASVTGVIDRIGFLAGSNADVALDEVRVGTSWNDLFNP